MPKMSAVWPFQWSILVCTIWLFHCQNTCGKCSFSQKLKWIKQFVIDAVPDVNYSLLKRPKTTVFCCFFKNRDLRQVHKHSAVTLYGRTRRLFGGEKKPRLFSEGNKNRHFIAFPATLFRLCDPFSPLRLVMLPFLSRLLFCFLVFFCSERTIATVMLTLLLA